MDSKSIENDINDGWEKLVLASLRGTFDNDNFVGEIPLDLIEDFQANNICEKYLEKYGEEIKYEFRNDLYYFSK